ncbi:MAG: SDR family NAD(P)-dependent oxidoreductase [Candidatus Caenarcaniphilales bacterium]|nr:SDR family NAD(P)-dependent oxidoreductase [Candidatus Caenarcaniphilales bacterium]
MSKKIAIVTGANRGIGKEIARQLASKDFKIVLACRTLEKANQAKEDLLKENSNYDLLELEINVADINSIHKAANTIKKQGLKIDVLVNNAGIFPGNYNSSIINCDIGEIKEALNTNTLGPISLIQSLVDSFNKGAEIINISSGMGQLSEMNGHCPAYRISKTGINAVTKIFAEELRPYGVSINSVCPGWVKTDMGGANATRVVSKGAETPVWLATENPGYTGSFFRDKELIEW